MLVNKRPHDRAPEVGNMAFIDGQRSSKYYGDGAAALYVYLQKYWCTDVVSSLAAHTVLWRVVLGVSHQRRGQSGQSIRYPNYNPIMEDFNFKVVFGWRC